MSKLSLPARLATLVAGTTLPLILFAGFITYQNYQADRDQSIARVLETARSIRMVLDAEVQRMTSGLEVLALTNAARQSDFVAFREIATKFLEQYPSGVLLVANRDGRQLFSSQVRDASTLPPRNNLDMVRKVFATGKPAYSNLFLGVVRNSMIVTVEAPVFDNAGKVMSVISFSPPIAIFQRIIEAQRPSPDWTISIFDSEGTNFARVPNPQETVGKRASPSLYAEMFKGPELSLETVSLEGVPLFTSVARSSVSGWIVAPGIAQTTVTSPLLRSLAITTGVGLISLLIGLGFAFRMAQTIARGEALHTLLVEELNHRVKNTLAIMQALASQTFRSASVAERRTFEGRLGALAEVHNLLSDEKWVGASVASVVERVLRPYAMRDAARIRASGPDVALSAPQAVTLSMILHEIATNAAKYGALANDTGRLSVEWAVSRTHGAPKIQLVWRETGGPKTDRPERKGFGSQLIERGARDQLRGTATVDYADDGVTCTIAFPVT